MNYGEEEGKGTRDNLLKALKKNTLGGIQNSTKKS